MTLVLGLLIAANPLVEVRGYLGDVAEQRFVDLTGRLQKAGRDGAGTVWRTRLQPAGEGGQVRFEATATPLGEGRTQWSYRVTNERAGLTVCSVAFPIVEGVRSGEGWADNRILWPSLYRGALIDNLPTAAGFEAQARATCKGVPHLTGSYQGDLCLPYFVYEGPGGAFGMVVFDPTHEVITLEGLRGETEMRYAVRTYPKIPRGASWEFGDIEVFEALPTDWHTVADRYRAWLIQQGFGPHAPRHREVASLTYGRWDEFRPAEAITWAKALGIRDVLLWVLLYGRGDQYYPCYFPNEQRVGREDLASGIAQLRAAGLNASFYTNGYLLSPLQTAADSLAWSQRYPDRYPRRLAENDAGYAESAAAYRAGHNFAGPWLHEPGGILPLRVRRPNFRWGEYPIYFWHQRPFYAACVAAPPWRKLFRDTARLHAELGAGGIFIDQVAAIHPEICAARGHGHDGDSFGFWNRAYLRLLEEVKQAGEPLQAGFYIEVEGAADLYARWVDRFLGGFAEPPERGFPQMLKYTVPWLLTDLGQPRLDDTAALERLVEASLKVGATFRFSVGQNADDTAPLQGPSAELLRNAIATRRALAPFMDEGRFRDDVGLVVHGGEGTWFVAQAGVLLVILANEEDAAASVIADGRYEPRQARDLDWRTGRERQPAVRAEQGRLVVDGLPPGLHLVVVPSAGP